MHPPYFYDGGKDMEDWIILLLKMEVGSNDCAVPVLDTRGGVSWLCCLSFHKEGGKCGRLGHLSFDDEKRPWKIGSSQFWWCEETSEDWVILISDMIANFQLFIPSVLFRCLLIQITFREFWANSLANHIISIYPSQSTVYM